MKQNFNIMLVFILNRAFGLWVNCYVVIVTPDASCGLEEVRRLRGLFMCLFVCFWRDSPQWARASSFTGFLDNTQRRTTVGRTPLDEWLARRRDLYLTTHNSHKRQTSMPPVGFEPTISAGERPQTYALDRAATGTGGEEVHNVSIWWEFTGL